MLAIPVNTNGRCVVAKEIMEDKSIRVKVVTFPGNTVFPITIVDMQDDR